MKINRQPTAQLQETLKRLGSILPPKYTIGEDKKKVFTQFGKGRETESLYARHISEELARRSA